MKNIQCDFCKPKKNVEPSYCDANAGSWIY